MNRSLAAGFLLTVASIAPATAHAGAGPITYSDWIGGCTVGEHADFSCVMRREARSVTGERLGFIAFGQGEISRFLFVEIDLPASAGELPLVTRIDGDLIANGALRCQETDSDSVCSTTVAVDDGLLRRLAGGGVLAIVTRQHEIKMRFPLKDFGHARKQFL
jgi:hypothetical protein